MKTMFICIVTTMVLAFTGNGNLIGRWETKRSEKGNVTGVVFKSDGTFEGYINKKPFVTATYTVEDSVISFVDNGCGGMKAVYKLVFFSNSDSLRFETISDSCTQRKEGMQKTILGRVR